MPTGEMPAALCREWFRTYPNIPLMNAYGPTECSDDVTLGPICGRLTSCGPHATWTVRNCQVAIVDRQLNLVPVGVPGVVRERHGGRARVSVDAVAHSFGLHT